MSRLHQMTKDELNNLPLAPLDCVYPHPDVHPEDVRVYADRNQDLWIALEWHGQPVKLFGLEAEQTARPYQYC